MQPLRFSWVCLLAVLFPGMAHGHGFTLGLTGNQLTVNSGAVPGDLFVHGMTTIIANDTYSVTHGLFSKQTTPSNPFAAGDTFRFDIISPLLYSDGSPVIPAGTGITMEGIHSQPPGQSITFDGSSVGTTPGYAVAATSTHHVQWVLSGLTSVSDLGAYGFRYRISGFKDGNVNDPYDPVNATVVLDTPGASYSTSLAEAREDMYAALQNFEAPSSSVIPEPATLAATLLGLVFLLPACRRLTARIG